MGGQELENTEALKTHRRSVYYSVYPEQGGKSPLGELFDAPDAQECYRRTRSIVPQQALALTNSNLVHEMSAEVVRGAADIDEPDKFIKAMFERLLSRSPSDREREICLKALKDHESLLMKAHPAESQAEKKARESLVRALFNHNDFITIR